MKNIFYYEDGVSMYKNVMRKSVAQLQKACRYVL